MQDRREQARQDLKGLEETVVRYQSIFQSKCQYLGGVFHFQSFEGF